MEPVPELVIRRSPENARTVLAISAVFGAMALFFLVLDPATIERYLDLPVMLVRAIAVTGLVGFGLLALLGLHSMFDRSPLLVVNSDGIVDYSSGVAARFKGRRLPWADIRDVTTDHRYGLTAISIHLKDRNHHASDIGEKSVIEIPVKAVAVTAEEMESVMRSHLRANAGRSMTE